VSPSSLSSLYPSDRNPTAQIRSSYRNGIHQ
jgi:hypothetical protein